MKPVLQPDSINFSSYSFDETDYHIWEIMIYVTKDGLVSLPNHPPGSECCQQPLDSPTRVYVPIWAFGWDCRSEADT